MGLPIVLFIGFFGPILKLLPPQNGGNKTLALGRKNCFAMIRLMRKWPIWILLVLLPLKLWAGAFMSMPVPMSMPSSTPPVVSATSHQRTADVAHTPCLHATSGTCQEVANGQPQPLHHDHDHAQHALHADHAQHLGHAQHPPNAGPALNNPHAHHDGMVMGAGFCPEGPGCLACSACHTVAGLPVNAQRFTNLTASAAPATPLAAWYGHAWPPLIKPPIS